MTMRGPRGQLPHHDTFRHSVPIRLAAYWVLALGCLVFAMVGLYPFPIFPILLLTALEAVTLAAVYRSALASHRAALAYLAIEGMYQTAIFHFSGALRLGIAPVVYTFELLNPGVRLSRRDHFIVANGFVALFAILVVGEHADLIAFFEPAPWPTASVLVVLLELNVAAVFVSEMRRVLEDRAVELALARDALRDQSIALEQRVSARTTELEASYRALQDRANEHRNFVYTVTHDLKAPLNAILLRTDRVVEREGVGLASETRADLARIALLAERGESMLRDLMAHFEVSESPEPQDYIDLGVTVRRALEPLESAIANKGLQVEIAEMPAVWGQAKKLTHVFANLLNNAVKFTPDAGRIRVETQLDGGSVVVCVADSGPGIPPGYENTIFNLFTRVPAPDGHPASTAGAEGTGVGLAIVRRIVEQHGGAVWVESPSGGGSRFYARFPLRSP